MPGPKIVSTAACRSAQEHAHQHAQHHDAMVNQHVQERGLKSVSESSELTIACGSISSLHDLTPRARQDLERQVEEFGLKFSRETFHEAKSCPAVTLINAGRFEDLDVADVIDLFHALDKDKSGGLEFEEVALFLKEVLDPPCTDDQVALIHSLADKNANTTISPEELHRALTAGPVKEHLSRLQRGNALKKRFEQDFGLNQPIERPFLVDRVRLSIDRDDAFRTLPCTLFFIIVFTFLVVVHLKVWERQQVERGVQRWMEGYGGTLQGPFLKEHVADVPSTVDWLMASGLPSLLGACQTGSASAMECYVGSRNLLLGDVKLTEVRHESSESLWLLNSEPSKQHLVGKPFDYLEAAKVALGTMRIANPAHLKHQDIEEVRLEFSTYGVESQMFTQSKISLRFDDYGTCLPAALITSVVIRPYVDAAAPPVICVVADAIFCLMILIPLVKELRDMIKGMRIAGLKAGFVHYWDVWNFVDWTLITMGSAQIITWIGCCFAMSDEAIQILLFENGDKFELLPNAINLDIATLELAWKSFSNIASWFFALHLSMCFCAIAIMLKFFKAFQANPRLRLVTDTLVKAGSDIFHFSVVFLAVFVGFAVTGHIFFGNDLVQFRSFSVSLDTCFIVLMGEFAWYAEAGDSDEALSSGLPFFVLLLWFWTYMVFVLLILLNMLLAIVLEHYAELVGQVKNDPDAISLAAQMKTYIAKLYQTQTFIPLTDIYTKLQDVDALCHEAHTVTEATLQAAFPDMKADQASWLMQWLKREARKIYNTSEDESIARLKNIEKCFRDLAADVNLVKLNVAVCTSRLKQRAANAAESGSKGLGNESNNAQATGVFSLPTLSEDLQEQVDVLSQKIDTSVRDLSWQVGGAVDELLSHGASLERAVEQAALSFQKVQVGRSGISTPLQYGVIHPLAVTPTRSMSKVSRLS